MLTAYDGSPDRLRDLEEPQRDGHVRTEELARGDPEEQRVADLPGGAGYRYSHGIFHYDILRWVHETTASRALYQPPFVGACGSGQLEMRYQ